MCELTPELIARLRALADEFLPLDGLFHVTHIEAAKAILQGGTIEARVPTDCVRLQELQIGVVWLTARSYPTSFFGACVFEFTPGQLLEGMRCYFVDDAPMYQAPTRRLLLTRRNLDGVLEAPNPEYFRISAGGTWEYNNFYNVQWLMDRDIAIANCESISFTDHNDRCLRFQQECPDLDLHPRKVGAIVLAHVFAACPPDRNRLFRNRRGRPEALTEAFSEGCRWLFRELAAECLGGAIDGPLEADFDIRRLLATYAQTRSTVEIRTALQRLGVNRLKEQLFRIWQEFFR